MKNLFINIQEEIWSGMKAGYNNDVKQAIITLLENDFIVRLHDSNNPVELENEIKSSADFIKQLKK